MTTDEELRTVADALDGAIVVAGTGDLADPVAERATASSRATVLDADSDAQAIVLAVDDAAPEPVSTLARTAGGSDSFVVTVVAVPADEGTVDPDLLESVRETGDATLLVPADVTARDRPISGEQAAGDPTVDGTFDFVTLIHEAGFVNLDLADARTILESGPLAALGRGDASLADRNAPETAVASAFDGMPASVDPDRAPGVLVDVVGDPTMSVADATAAVTAVRERVGAGAHVIWGGAVDETLTDELRVRIVVADVAYAPTPTAGDPCPRCGVTLSAYAFGDAVTLSCDGCGFAGVSTVLE